MPIVSAIAPTTILIDGDPVRLHIKRMSIDEWTAFSAEFQAYGRDFQRGESASDRKRQELLDRITPEQMAARRAEMVRWARLAATKRAAALTTDPTAPVAPADVPEPSDEEVRHTLVPSAAQVLAALEEDLSKDDLKRLREEELDHKRLGDAFTIAGITAYVTIVEGDIKNADTDTWITSGEELVRMYGPRPDVLSDVMQEIFLQNRLSDDDKKKLRLLRDSQRSSTRSVQDAGEIPGSIAESAARSATAETAAATT